MEKQMTYKEILAVDDFIYRMIDNNPIGKYHRMEDFYDMVLFRASTEARRDFEARGKEWPQNFNESVAAQEPYMLKHYMRYVDEDRDELLKELEKCGFDSEKALGAFMRGLEKIRELDDKKELMDTLAENAYAKCAFNLMLYEFLK